VNSNKFTMMFMFKIQKMKQLRKISRISIKQNILITVQHRNHQIKNTVGYTIVNEMTLIDLSDILTYSIVECTQSSKDASCLKKCKLRKIFCDKLSLRTFTRSLDTKQRNISHLSTQKIKSKKLSAYHIFVSCNFDLKINALYLWL